METRVEEYPQSYPRIVQDVLKAMTVKKIEVVGTASLRSVRYSADIDAHDIVPNLTAKQFQGVIRRLKALPIQIGDIKCGTDESKRVIPADAYIKDCEVIGVDMSPVKFLEAKATRKEHILRWTPAEVLKGKHKSGFTLSEALKTPGTVKVDTLVFTEGRYIEVTCVYITKETPEGVVERELKESVLANIYDGNLFKASRRIFSLARLEGDTPTVRELTALFNSDLGNLYIILSDIHVLQDAGKLPKNKLAQVVEGLRIRLSELNASSTLLKGKVKPRLLGNTPLTLTSLEKELSTVLQNAAQTALKELGLFPVPHKYLP